MSVAAVMPPNPPATKCAHGRRSLTLVPGGEDVIWFGAFLRVSEVGFIWPSPLSCVMGIENLVLPGEGAFEVGDVKTMRNAVTGVEGEVEG